MSDANGHVGYSVVDVEPDSPEWLMERRETLGASEVAAVLGVSPWETPLTVYLSKRGIDRGFDEQLAFIGHEQEHLMEAWLKRFHLEVGSIEPAKMIRNEQYPWLHASLDRIAVKGGLERPIQMKTGSHFTMREWEEGTPDWVRIQVQTEMLVMGSDSAWIVVFIGGRKFILREELADPVVQEQIVRITHDWWTAHVLAGVEPAPSSISEIETVKFNSGQSFAGDDRLLMAWYLDGLERSAYKQADERIEAVKTAYKELLQQVGADSLTYEGTALYTWKRSKDILSFDRAGFERDHPELVQKYTRPVPGPLRFLRKTVEEFETSPPAGWIPGRTVADVLSEYQDLTAWKSTIKEENR